MTRAVLQAGTRGGPPVQDTRAWRVTATDAGVVETWPDGRQVVVAGPGEVARVVVVRSGDLGRRLRGGDVMSLLGDDRVLMTIALGSVHLGPSTTDPDLQRATSGVADFARTIGLTLEAATADDISRVNAAPGALTRGRTIDLLRRRRWLHLALMAWLAAAWVVLGTSDIQDVSTVLVADLVFLPPMLWLAVAAWGRSRTFLRQQASAPGDRVAVPNVAPPARWAWIREAQLQIGADDVVHVQHVRESWLPGPRRGGVVACEVSPDALWLLDRHGVVLSVMAAEPWVPAGAAPDALARACREAGISVRRRSVPDLPPDLVADLSPEVYASPQALLYSMTSQERGSLFVAANLLVAASGLFAGSANLIAPLRSDLGGVTTAAVVALGVVAVTVSVTMGVIELGFVRWNRRQMQTAPDAPEETHRDR